MTLSRGFAGGAGIAVAIGAAIAFYIMCCVLFRDNLKIGGGVLSFYRRENLVHRFTINDTGFRANISPSMCDSDCILTVTERYGFSEA